MTPSCDDPSNALGLRSKNLSHLLKEHASGKQVWSRLGHLPRQARALRYKAHRLPTLFPSCLLVAVLLSHI